MQHDMLILAIWSLLWMSEAGDVASHPEMTMKRTNATPATTTLHNR